MRTRIDEPLGNLRHRRTVYPFHSFLRGVDDLGRVAMNIIKPFVQGVIAGLVVSAVALTIALVAIAVLAVAHG